MVWALAGRKRSSSLTRVAVARRRNGARSSRKFFRRCTGSSPLGQSVDEKRWMAPEGLRHDRRRPGSSHDSARRALQWVSRGGPGRPGQSTRSLCESRGLRKQERPRKRALRNGTKATDRWRPARWCLEGDIGCQRTVRFRSRLLQPRKARGVTTSGVSRSSRESGENEASRARREGHAWQRGAKAMGASGAGESRCDAGMHRDWVFRSWHERIALSPVPGPASANCVGPRSAPTPYEGAWSRCAKRDHEVRARQRCRNGAIFRSNTGNT